jgi:lysophospholipase L1-like esterase
VIDWATISLNHPEFFAIDGVHLNPPGVNAYVSAILEVLNK